ncbi:hypothetical protein B566_EDAN014541 [Ephemera danica]|nr:hypothetical protein B566_EDAN014541 [Ephemera danica]
MEALVQGYAGRRVACFNVESEKHHIVVDSTAHQFWTNWPGVSCSSRARLVYCTIINHVFTIQLVKMQKVIECVPNFSVGRDKEVIEAIAASIRGTVGATLLDVDPGASTNRTVYTFVGDPDAVVTAALNAARVASRLIDMASHSGEHPRLGAMDVCPFVPVRGVEVEECIYCAMRFAEKLAAEINVPVYLYGEAAKRGAHRRTVPQIRAGEYEGLTEKLKQSDWQPDFGPATFVPQWGATMVGVRPFLLAYNINLLGTKEQAHRIALNVREQGRGAGQPGRLRAVQGMGWWLDEANLAQVSLNILDHNVTPLHAAYEAVCRDAEELGVAVVGSELVGLVPLAALLQVANFYMEKDGLLILEESQKVRLAITRLGLNSLGSFNPSERIIEYRLPRSEARPLLADLTTRGFIEAVGARSPAPGGGSVAALLGSLQWDHLDKEIRRLLPTVHDAMIKITPIIDDDAAAFNEYMAAGKLPRSNAEEISARERALSAALDHAVNVPLNLAKSVNKLWPVGAKCLETSVMGAYFNVQINLRSVSDVVRRAAVASEAEEAVSTAKTNCEAVLAILTSRLND